MTSPASLRGAGGPRPRSCVVSPASRADGHAGTPTSHPLAPEDRLAALARAQLALLGGDPEREGLPQTPTRVARRLTWRCAA